MNPVGEEGNMFSSLFDKVPAKRAGSDEDIAGVVLYLSSRAGVGRKNLRLSSFTIFPTNIEFRLTSMESLYALMEGEYCWPMAKSDIRKLP